ncbi:MAG: FAD-dependent oxidoreductase [Halanaerobiaceae bacterium]
MADYISLGRALVADPRFIAKYQDTNREQLRPCLACTAGCLGGVKAGKGLQCTVNPDVGNEMEPIIEAGESKKVAVIGGGLAGMESALTLKKRGHEVTIFEKDEFGGQFNYAFLPTGKKTMARILDYYKTGIENENIDIIYEEPSEEKLISSFEEVVVATGSEPAVPPISGLENVDYYWAEIMQKDKIPENKNVFIIGGGLIGVDIATALVDNDNNVTIVKRTTDFGEDMETITKKLSLNKLKMNNVTFSDHTNITRIEEGAVYAERKGEEIKFENIDIYVVSTGMKSYYPFSENLEENIPVHIVGDAHVPGNVQNAIKSGREVALKI